MDDDIPLKISLEPVVNVSSIISHWDPGFPKNLLGANVSCPNRMPVALISDIAVNNGLRVRNLTLDRYN